MIPNAILYNILLTHKSGQSLLNWNIYLSNVLTSVQASISGHDKSRYAYTPLFMKMQLFYQARVNKWLTA